MITAKEAIIISENNRDKKLSRESEYQKDIEKPLIKLLFDIIKKDALDGYRESALPPSMDHVKESFYDYFENLGFKFEPSQRTRGGITKTIERGCITW